jgi:hypothetical protein
MALTQIKSTGTDFSANAITVNQATITTLYRGSLPQTCDDISNYVDGTRNIFALTVGQNYINTVTDSRDIQLTINGTIQNPYIAEQRLPWIIEYDSFRGYRVVGANIIIYNPPDPGDQVTLTQTGTSATTQTRQYPYSATTIALGD